MQWAVNPREDVDATLSEAQEMAANAGVEVQIFARQGDPADAILDVAEETKADLIIVGNKGMTGARRFLPRLRAEQGLPPRALQRADHPDD
jgi:nucleotide-binding universal stress UspA family protein